MDAEAVKSKFKGVYVEASHKARGKCPAIAEVGGLTFELKQPVMEVTLPVRLTDDDWVDIIFAISGDGDVLLTQPEVMGNVAKLGDDDFGDRLAHAVANAINRLLEKKYP